MRTKLKGLLTGMMVFVMMLAGAMVVQAASGSVTFGSNSYTKNEGEEFNVGVYVKGDVDIATYNFYITYDEDKIEYVSGADSGGSGRLSFAGSMSSDSRKYKKLWLTFKAKAAGQFTMSVTDVYLGPLDVANGDSLSVSKSGSAPITIKAAGSASGDCDLKSISIAETGFYGFSADKTQYDITVENKYEKLTVTAKAADSNATVEISDTTLKVGTNYINIKVTAQNGESSKTYKIIVRRKAGSAGETTSSTETTTPQEPPTIPDIDELKSYYSYNDKELYFTKTLDGVTVPEGFEKVKVTVEGQEYEVLTNSNGTIVLYYLVDVSGQNGCLYVYSNAKDAVYPYVVLTNSNHSYMVDEVENPEVPEGYQKVNMVIKGVGGANEEVSVIAWYHADAPDFYLLYASCDGGTPALYQYDVNENTIQKYNGIKGTTQIVEGNDDSDKVKELEEKIEKLEKDKKSEAKTWMLVVIVLAVLCIILVVIVVALFYKMRDQMEYESYDDDDDDYVASAVSDEDERTVSAPRTEKKGTKTDFDDDDDFTFFDMDDDR